VLTSPVTAISAGNAHTCATAVGKAYCWGNNKYGQLGNNTATDSPVPVAVDTSGVLTGAVSTISAGNGATCAAAGGAAYCWGSNASGQLGNNTTTDSPVPVAVDIGTGTVATISTGYSHTCATAGGKAYCWGSNTSGELGNGTTIGSKVPVGASTSGVLTGAVTAISAGTDFTCAVASGKAYCWGFNGHGELGNNTTTGSSVPVAVETSGVLTGTVTAISAGGLQTAALSISRYLSVSPTALSFGSQRVDSSSPEQKVTVTNSGAEDLTVSAVTLGGPDPAQFVQGSETCTGAPLVPNATCTVMVGFDPTSAGDKSATLTVTRNAPGSPAVVTLSGTGSRKQQTLKPGLPKRIKLSGLTLITPADARTNAGQRVRTIVRGGPTKASAAGDVRYYVVVRGPKGKVSVRTFGRRDLKLVVTQKAPATAGHTEFNRSATYVAGKRR
jgi:Regulator of chromosome condensation (RCC1) repeat/Abnormal spindle-like microcephaly-assoc'd, ASPM-SPD-2-Hydin